MWGAWGKACIPDTSQKVGRQGGGLERKVGCGTDNMEFQWCLWFTVCLDFWK